MASKTLRLRVLAGAIVLGVLVSLASRLVENPPEARIIGAKYYGYPLVWRVDMITLTNTITFRFTSLAIDIIFWFAISFVVLIILKRIVPRSRESIESFS